MEPSNRQLRQMGVRVVDSGLWVGLHTGDSEPDRYSELAGLGYVRVPLNGYRWAGVDIFWFAVHVHGDLPYIPNACPIEFPPALEDWPLITHASLWNDAQQGRVLQGFDLGGPLVIKVERHLIFERGMLHINFLGPAVIPPKHRLLPAPG